ncbi:TCP-1/cpn60 chaperonin family protein [Halorarum halophilum]|uniref:TCP-1/cpn60 chaperonin family protein n=1 Tax=Halorarum halophilum TaxID=2743090 RepID=A0A7D5K7B0_9EURY|nr:TCP-1/cpn60 chaperonin family protein [Halobaculum halophilum]QLG27319.1 TCP-1/cpn60 chaperonin family protein [Halobaculum halophilum]
MEGGRKDVDYAPVDAGSWTLRDEEARTFVSAATRTVASLVRSTLGPNGMSTQVQTVDNVEEPETVLTSDASEILDAIERGGGFGHPVAALFVDAVDGMRRELGDGSTTAVLLGEALVDEGVDLVEAGLHPGNVVVGFSMAAARAGAVLDALAREVDPEDVDLLERVAATSMTGDLDATTREAYAARVAETIRVLAEWGDTDWIDTDDAKVLAGPEAPGGRYRGVVVRRYPGPLDESDESLREFDWSMLEPMTDATVALVDEEIDVEKTATPFGQGSDPGVEIESFEQWTDYTEGLNRRVAALVDRLDGMGVDVLVSQERLDDRTRTAFESGGVAVVDEVKYPLVDVYRLARASGGTVVDDLSELTPDQLGMVGSITERRVGDEKWTFFDDCEGAVYTLIVDVETETASAEHERMLEDALEVTATAATDGQVLPGAGAPAMAVAADLRGYATSISDLEQLAIEAFADALESVPAALAANAGADRLDLLAALRAEHATNEGPISAGVSVDGESFDAWEAGVVEPRRLFSQAVETANSVAEQLLTVDAVIHPGVDLGEFRPEPERD